MPPVPYIALALMLSLSACSAWSPVENFTSAPSETESVAMALAKGDLTKNPKSRAQAAQTLMALGARPADNTTPDLAELWAKKASDDAMAPVYRGRILGPAYRNGSIVPGSAAATHQLFLAGHVAQVSVSASKGSRLNLAVTDSKGKAICQISVGSPVGSCKWIPTFSERFEVTIGNLGPKNARYYLAVN